MRAYAGVGPRATPEDPTLYEITQVGMVMAQRGLVLRSGGADGADTAFEHGCDLAEGQKEIYLPWKEYNDHKSTLYHLDGVAFDIAESLHPNWKNLSQGVKRLHARNVHIILGKKLDDPVDFVVCWTADGAKKAKDVTQKTGGTGMAIRIADAYDIPVLNLYYKWVYERLLDGVDTLV